MGCCSQIHRLQIRGIAKLSRTLICAIKRCCSKTHRLKAVHTLAPLCSPSSLLMSLASSVDDSSLGLNKLSHVLCVGMCYTASKHVALLKTARDTTCAPIRDRERIVELEKTYGCIVFTVNDGQTVDEAEEGRHCQVTFSNRAVKEMIRCFECRLFTHVFLDYIRFPGAYMLKAYGPFSTATLPGLIHNGALRPGGMIVVPNADCLQSCLRELIKMVFSIPVNVPNSSMLIGKKMSTCVLIQENLPAAWYPLYHCTSSQSNQGLLESMGGISNEAEVRNLGTKKNDSPFFALHLVERS